MGRLTGAEKMEIADAVAECLNAGCPMEPLKRIVDSIGEVTLIPFEELAETVH